MKRIPAPHPELICGVRFTDADGREPREVFGLTLLSKENGRSVFMLLHKIVAAETLEPTTVLFS